MRKAWYIFYFITVLIYAIVAVPMGLTGIMIGNRYSLHLFSYINMYKSVACLFWIYYVAHILLIDKILFVVFAITVLKDSKKQRYFLLNTVSFVLVVLTELRFIPDAIIIAYRFFRWHKLENSLSSSLYLLVSFAEVILAVIIPIVLITRKRKARLARLQLENDRG